MRLTHVRLEIRPDKAELYEQTFLRLRDLVIEREPGCAFIELCRDPSAPGVYHVFEAYADQAAVDAHTSTDYYHETARIFIECLAGDHMDKVRAQGLTGREMYSVVDNILFERFETVTRADG